MKPNKSLIAGLYNQTNARGATPIGLIIAQFDQVIRDLRRAVLAFDLGHIEERTAHLNHALLVIAQLQNVLDHHRGGQAAKRFEQFYNVTRSMILEAQIGAKREKLLECIELYSTLRQAWQEADQKATGTPAGSMVAPESGSQRRVFPIEPELVEVGRGNWSA
jgi:flagellar biosynthetic protein FliS